MSVRSAAQEVLEASEPQQLALPAGKPPEAAPAARRSRGRPYPFHRALGHSALAHGLTFLALFLAGAGPEVAEGRPASSARLVLAQPSAATWSRAAWDAPAAEPERALDAAEPPEPELRPVEPELVPQLPAPAEAELAEPADPLEALRRLPLEPLAALALPSEPAPEAAPAAEPARPEPAPTGAPLASAADYRPPSVAASEPPAYPHASYRMGHEGSALLRIHVAADGRVLDVELVESSGYERLDQAALTSARTWEFHPATRGGVRVADWLLHRVTFRIEE